MRRERIAGILMAAGASQRLGQSKQLLVWRGRPLIAHVAQTALDARLDPVIVVIGHRAGEMRAALQSLAVIVVENPRWPDGMSTSMHAGLSALPADVDAALFLLVDQPRITADYLRAMVAAYRASRKPIVVSAFQGKRASPTLFDRSLFDQLRRITGDVGGRAVIDASPNLVAMVEADDEATLLDIDTPEDWQRIGNGLLRTTDKRIPDSPAR